MLEPLLWYINNLDVSARGMDGMKITGVVDSEEGCQSLWQDIDQIES